MDMDSAPPTEQPKTVACRSCGLIEMPWNGESSVCDQCLARNQGSVTAHRVQQGFSHISPLSSRVTQTPIELMEDKMYIGDVLSNRDLQQLHSHNVTVVIYFQTEPYNTPLYTQVQQMVTACGMEYNPVPSTAGVFQMYEYISEKITRGHKVAVYGVGQNDDHGAVVLLAFLMEFAGLTFHLARELLREKGILHPDAMNGDATERVDDLADAFAML